MYWNGDCLFKPQPLVPSYSSVYQQVTIMTVVMSDVTCGSGISQVSSCSRKFFLKPCVSCYCWSKKFVLLP